MIRSIAKHLLPSLPSIPPAHLSIVKNMMIVAIFVGVGKLFGALKEVVVAYYFGISQVLDAYNIAFTWVTWAPVVWQGVVVFASVPILATLDLEDKRRFASELIGMTFILGFVTSLATLFILPQLLHMLIPQAPHTVVEQTEIALKSLSPAGILMTLSGSYFALLLSKEQHVNTLADSLPAIGLTFFLLAWFVIGVKAVDAVPLVLGSLIGFGLMLVALIAMAARAGIAVSPSFRFTRSTWQLFWQIGLFAALNQMFLSLFIPIDQIFAVRLGEGSVAILSYVNRILFLIIGLLSLAVGRSLLPILSRMSSQDWRVARRIAFQWSGALFALGIALAALGWLLAPTGVKLMFERGAFTAQDTTNVSAVLRYAMVQIPFYLVSIVLTYLIASSKQHIVIAAVAGVMVLVKLAANELLLSELGLQSVVVATAIAYLLSCVLYGLWVLFYKKMPTSS